MKIGYKLFLYILLLFMLSGCKVNKGTPAIEKDKMTEILVDIYTAQSLLEREPTLPNNAKKEYYYCQILERHGVTEAIFDSAVAWYAANMDVYEKVYADVIAKLERDKAALEQK